MKQWKQILTHPITSVVAFALAAVLLLFSGIGGARAALTYYSETYTSRYGMYDIGVSLIENGSRVAWRDYTGEDTWDETDTDDHVGVLLSSMIPEGESLKLGANYTEELCVTNSGTINQYVRVSIYKYWLDADGNKLTNLSPSLIDLNLINLDSAWLLDESASTTERTVLYYNKLLNAGETTPLFSDTLTISGMVATKVTQTSETTDGKTVITTTYDYNGVRFLLEAKVDAVQEHNAQDAAWSAWGRQVTISGNSLSLA